MLLHGLFNLLPTPAQRTFQNKFIPKGNIRPSVLLPLTKSIPSYLNLNVFLTIKTTRYILKACMKKYQIRVQTKHSVIIDFLFFQITTS